MMVVVLGECNVPNDSNNYDGVCGDDGDGYSNNNNTIIKTMIIRGKTRR